MTALQMARRVSAALLIFMIALLVVTALAHAQSSAYESVECRDAAGNLVVTEAVEPLTEHLRVRPTDYFRVVREAESVVYFGLGPLYCRAVRSE